MADGISAAAAVSLLNLLFKGTTFAGYSTVYIQLHVGAPGTAGTTNVAGNTTRIAVSITTFTTGTSTNSADVSWTSVSTSETYSHISIWSAATSGVFIASGSITASAVTSGDNFTIPSGDCTIAMATAS